MSLVSNKNLIIDTIKDYKEGLGFIDSTEAKFIDWDDVSVWKKPEKPQRRFLNWVSKDFVGYARMRHYKRYGKDWEVNFVGACAELVKLKDSILDKMGFCDNVVLRDYIDFFFDRYADYFISKKKIFIFPFLREDWVIDKFINSYDYNESINNTSKIYKENHNYDKKVESKSISIKDVEDSFLLSEERLIVDFGLVVAINWIAKKKNISIRDAIKSVYTNCLKICRKNKFDAVIKSTERYSPYPDTVKFKQVDKLIEKINSTVNSNFRVNVDFRKK